MQHTHYEESIIRSGRATLVSYMLGSVSLHDTDHEEGSNGEFLAEVQTQLEHFDHWQDQDDNIHHEMQQEGAIEEGRVIDVTLPCDGLVPVVRDWPAAKADHEGAQQDPYHGDDKQHNDGYSDRGVFEYSPVQ